MKRIHLSVEQHPTRKNLWPFCEKRHLPSFLHMCLLIPHSWLPCPKSPSSPYPLPFLPFLQGTRRPPRRPGHPAKPISVKCYQRKHLRTSSYTCCHWLPGPPASMQVSPWEERTHSGLWLVVFQPSSSDMAERKDRRREQSLPRCLGLRAGHLTSFMAALRKLDALQLIGSRVPWVTKTRTASQGFMKTA